MSETHALMILTFLAMVVITVVFGIASLAIDSLVRRLMGTREEAGDGED